jgi:hypothetical protein
MGRGWAECCGRLATANEQPQIINLQSYPVRSNICDSSVAKNSGVTGSADLPSAASVPFRATQSCLGEAKVVAQREPGLIEGFLLCLRDSEAVRMQPSRWKRSLLVFSSGVCLEIAFLPFLVGLVGYETSWHAWFLTSLFAPLGVIGLYASRFGDDQLVESLLIVPKLDLRI